MIKNKFMKKYLLIFIQTILGSGIAWLVTGNWRIGAFVLIGTTVTVLINHFYKKEVHKISNEELTFHSLHATSNKEELANSKLAGCFYCKKIFNAFEIKDWAADRRGDTAICPYCGIDSVYGDASGKKVDEETLSIMYKLWFNEKK